MMPLASNQLAGLSCPKFDMSRHRRSRRHACCHVPLAPKDASGRPGDLSCHRSDVSPPPTARSEPCRQTASFRFSFFQLYSVCFSGFQLKYPSAWLFPPAGRGSRGALSALRCACLGVRDNVAAEQAQNSVCECTSAHACSTVTRLRGPEKTEVAFRGS